MKLFCVPLFSFIETSLHVAFVLYNIIMQVISTFLTILFNYLTKSLMSLEINVSK